MVRDAWRQVTSRGPHVISLADKSLTLGRGREADICIADVSISRLHASIGFQGGEFVLQDNNSQFGTLVAMRKPQMVEHGSSLSSQMGRTVLRLSVDALT